MLIYNRVEMKILSNNDTISCFFFLQFILIKFIIFIEKHEMSISVINKFTLKILIKTFFKTLNVLHNR